MQSGDVPAVVPALEQARRVHPETAVIIVVAQGRDEDASASEGVASGLLAAIPSARLAHAVIRDRASVAAAFQQGLTVFETIPVDGLATAEIEELAAEVYGAAENAHGAEREIRTAMATLERSRHGARHRFRI